MGASTIASKWIYQTIIIYRYFEDFEELNGFSKIHTGSSIVFEAATNSGTQEVPVPSCFAQFQVPEPRQLRALDNIQERIQAENQASAHGRPGEMSHEIPVIPLYFYDFLCVSLTICALFCEEPIAQFAHFAKVSCKDHS